MPHHAVATDPDHQPTQPKLPPENCPTCGRHYADLYLECVECGTQFVFKKKEQAFFAQRQLSFPRRCKPCRERRRQFEQK